ncbi:MAG TPA: ABC transporter permease [Blastocatellia bacterium]|nr:ABC transporter permease [Blastocatellia bacterium]HMX28173.1 ABC transporter permease [Blastocatellia bacterium]HMZ17092.1 ABC transporter permease [Blastocatellia bacterium]HNG32361.1 ABC transporter permease [Blastocatellia bacterium]
MEWEAELRTREALLAEWDKLNWQNKLNLLWRSTSAFWDALWLLPKRWEDDMIQDVRFGARMLRKHPGFSVVVVLTLALGIGANVALFSVVNGVLLNPLPFPQPEQLVSLHQSKPNFATGAIPYPNFRDWQKENRTFSAMAISRRTSFSLLGAEGAEQVDGRWVSAEYFSALGVQPALGRDFAAGEDERGAAPVAIISAALWQRKFGAMQDVAGKSLTLGDKSYTIIGVLPAGFTLMGDTDVYAPIGQWGTPALQNRRAALGLHGIGRLKPGVTLAQAQADLGDVMRRLAESYPDANRGHGAAVIPLKDRLVGDVRMTLWMLFGAVGFVLLIACVNVSNLLLARSTGRMREFAVRAALGAGRWRLLRQSLAESILLAGLGGGLGLLAASVGTQTAIKLLPTALPRAGEIRLDARVLLFTAGVSLLTGVLAGLVPALKTSQHRLSEMLKAGGRGAGNIRSRAQSALVAVEMALAVVLLVGAGLMIRSLSALWQADPGFRADNVLTFGLGFPPSLNQEKEQAARSSLRELSDKLNSMPGVRAASFSAGAAPLQGEDDLYFWLDGQPKPANTSEMNMTLVYRVEPAYLAAMSIPLKQGRFFTAQDKEQTQPVAVIDEAFARQYFPNTDPIGKGIRLGDDDPALQIVGVVGHVKQWSLATEDQQSLQAQLYLPLRQLPGTPSRVSVVMRFEGEKAAAPSFDAVRRVVQTHHRENVVFGAQTLKEILAESLAAQRFAMILLEAFAAVALLLASIGLYGVISYLAGQRTHELGIRLALGAQRRDVLRLVLSDGMKPACGGVALGLIVALGLTRLLANLLYGVSATDPLTFAATAALLAAIALLACWLPARRATKVDPVVALRSE